MKKLPATMEVDTMMNCNECSLTNLIPPSLINTSRKTIIPTIKNNANSISTAFSGKF